MFCMVKIESYIQIISAEKNYRIIYSMLSDRQDVMHIIKLSEAMVTTEVNSPLTVI